MEVLIYPDPILRRGGQPITEFDQELADLAARMMEAMYEEGGVGLAAPQVGIEKKLLVLNPSGSKDDRSGERVLCTPKITRKKKWEFGEEGCLSFPGIQAEVERSLGTALSARFTVNPDLLGGLVVRVEDTVYDQSVATGLVRLAERLKQRSIHEIQHRRDRLGSA